MLQTLESQEALGAELSFRERFLRGYRFMVLSRLLDDKMASLYRGGKIHGGVFLGRGQEALSVSVGLSLKKGDIFAPLIRDGAGRLAFGEPVLDAVRTYLGSVLGPMRGRDGNVHRGHPRRGLLPMISHLGAMISVVNGMLLARRLQKNAGGVGAVCIGDGGTSTGAFHEALNQASVEKLPLVLVVANNQFAYSTPNSRQFACEGLVDKAPGYGVTGHRLDGTDLEACLNTLAKAVSDARAGRGPQLVVAELLRLCGHGEHDDAHYIGARIKASPVGRDCLQVAEEYLRRQGWADAATMKGFRQEAAQLIEETVAKVQKEPAPDPFQQNWCALASRHLSERFETYPPANPL
jgi:pyruvate dehydrogenase E1 component alpha subunit/2-oxoisovalerate dehydrogenase E1 component alpha subunit